MPRLAAPDLPQRLWVPSPPEITGAVRRLSAAGERGSASIRELCAELWPALPWLPKVPGENNARCTPFRWMLDPPLADGRRAWDAPCADWLWCELEALVKARKLEHAAQGPDAEHIIDAVATVRYRLGPDAVQHPPRKRGAQGRWRRDGGRT